MVSRNITEDLAEKKSKKDVVISHVGVLVMTSEQFLRLCDRILSGNIGRSISFSKNRNAGISKSARNHENESLTEEKYRVTTSKRTE
jgi:hypothetical protein